MRSFWVIEAPNLSGIKIYFREKYKLSEEDYLSLKDDLETYDLARFDDTDQNHWNIIESIYFCLVVITTIGKSYS